MKKLLLTVFLILVSNSFFAQYGYRDSNRIGINVGLNQFSLNTDNFVTKPDKGWNAGLSVRGNFYDNWDIIYNIQFSENNFSLVTDNSFFTKENVNLKLQSAQLSLQLSYVLIDNYLSLEFGPLVQVGSKFKFDLEKKDNFVYGTSLTVKDIDDINKFNFYPVVGITAGVKHFRLNVSYQYGINNMLDNLNTKNLGYHFKGHPGILNGNIILYL